MRPRVFPAEDIRHGPGVCPLMTASMRPRVFPAEDAQLEHFESESALLLQ